MNGHSLKFGPDKLRFITRAKITEQPFVQFCHLRPTFQSLVGRLDKPESSRPFTQKLSEANSADMAPSCGAVFRLTGRLADITDRGATR